MKKRIIAIIALMAIGAQAALFDGASDSVYKATSDNANVSLVSAAGTHTLSNNSGADQGASVFGNFSGAALTNIGDSVTLSFRVSNMPAGAHLRYGFSGARSGVLHSSDVSDFGFARAYATYGVSKGVNNLGATFYNLNGGPAGNTTEDRNILNFGLGVSLGTWNSAGNPDRFNVGSTANFTFTITRAATQFDISGTMDVVGGNGVQQMDTFSVTPGANDMALTDAFTTFSIGAAGTDAYLKLDAGTSLVISDINVISTTIEGAAPQAGSLFVISSIFTQGYFPSGG